MQKKENDKKEEKEKNLRIRGDQGEARILFRNLLFGIIYFVSIVEVTELREGGDVRGRL